MSSNNARKKAARLYMQQSAEPITHPEALRVVSKRDYRQPLTAAIGADVPAGAQLRVNLEEASAGGSGPHIGIFGPTGAGKTTLLLTMVHSMLAAPPTRGVEVVLATAPWFASDIEGVISIGDPRGLEVYLGSLIRAREMWLDTNGVRDLAPRDELPAAVIAIDDVRWLYGDAQRPPSTLEHAFRAGRSLDIHLVVAQQAQAAPLVLNPHLPSWIELHSGQKPGDGHWHRYEPSRGWVDRPIHVPALPAPSRGDEGKIDA